MTSAQRAAWVGKHEPHPAAHRRQSLGFELFSDPLIPNTTYCAGVPSKLRLGGRVQARVAKSSGDPTLAAKTRLEWGTRVESSVPEIVAPAERSRKCAFGNGERQAAPNGMSISLDQPCSHRGIMLYLTV